MSLKISAVCVGAAERLMQKSYKTGIFKHPVTGPVMVDAQGIVGDAVCNKKHHGGVDQAVYVEGGRTLAWWSEQLGYPLEPGTFGENLVIEGLDNRDVAVGDLFEAGEVVLQATAARIPCATFSARMNESGFARRYAKAARPGIYCRVLHGGIVEAGLAVRHQLFNGERIPVAEMMKSFGQVLSPEERHRQLSAPIAERVRARLERDRSSA